MARVEIEDGLLEGEKIQNKFAGSYCSFKGIPYAAPPVGDLRFKAPQPVHPWKGVREAKEFGPVCYQFNHFTKEAMGQEDCLYLNVYTPDLTPIKPLPVMVWIHGGGFKSGSGNDDFYGPEYLVKQGVILVTFNYRLEALGFLCLHTKDVPGNAGIKDQVSVLRWVQKNIKKFGGNPNNVTVFGESAGAACVSYHLISPLSKNVFKRAILQSGAFTNWWSIDKRPRERALALAKQLGCITENDNELTLFFKSLPVESLINLRVPITMCEGFKEYIDVYFGIVNEESFPDTERFFFKENDNILPKIHEDVEIIIGYTEHEGILGLESSLNINTLLNQANFYPEFFVPKSITYKCTINEQLEIGNKVKKFYFENNMISTKNMDQIINFLSSDIFVYGIICFAKIFSRTNRIRLYKFACKSKRNIFTNIFTKLSNDNFVCHADDLGYIFPLKFAPQEIKMNSKEFQMIETITKLWTNFAKYGDPTPDTSMGVRWEPFNLEQQHFVQINEKIVAHSFPEINEINFWDAIYKQYYPHYVV